MNDVDFASYRRGPAASGALWFWPTGLRTIRFRRPRLVLDSTDLHSKGAHMSTSNGQAPTTNAHAFTLVDKTPHLTPKTVGEYSADKIAAIVGSWQFIITQSALLGLWILLNAAAWIQHWDPYPFILLNLVLSFQAAFTAPIIMMAQNRQSDIDRHKAQLDYDVNLRAELDITALHQKIDLMREQDIARLIGLLETLTEERLAKDSEAKA